MCCGCGYFHPEGREGDFVSLMVMRQKKVLHRMSRRTKSPVKEKALLRSNSEPDQIAAGQVDASFVSVCALLPGFA